MRKKLKLEVLSTNHLCLVKGGEPFRTFRSPRMYLNLNEGGKSHNFKEKIDADFLGSLQPGDMLTLQWCKVTQVPMTRLEIVLQWFLGWI